MNTELTINLEIGNVIHKMTVEEAKSLLEKLQQALGERPPTIVYKDYPQTIPWWTPPIITYDPPPTYYRLPEITCMAGIRQQ